MNNIKTIKLALEALESCGWNDGYAGKTQYFHDELVDKAIATLRQAIKQAQQEEPIGYLCENAVGHKYFRWKKPSGVYKPIPLYTSPPPRQPLTDEEILDVNMSTVTKLIDEPIICDTDHNIIKYARAIEAAHGIKETT